MELNKKKPKDYKLIELEINHEIKQINEKVYESYSKYGKPSFVAIEVKKYLKQNGFMEKKRKVSKRY